MKVIGRKIKLMEKENTFTLMEQFMRVIGNMINNMAMAKRIGLMELSMKVDSKMEAKKDKAFYTLQMVLYMKDNFQ